MFDSLSVLSIQMFVMLVSFKTVATMSCNFVVSKCCDCLTTLLHNVAAYLTSVKFWCNICSCFDRLAVSVSFAPTMLCSSAR